MLRLAVALLALLTPASALLMDGPSHHGPAAHSAHHTTAAPWTPFDLDVPAGTSWVAVPFLALENVTLDLNVSHPAIREGATYSSSIVLTSIERADGATLEGLGGSSSELGRFAQANAAGARIACCNEEIASFHSPGGGGWSASEGTYLRAGETLWFTLIVVETDADEPIDARFRATGGEVEIGAARSGTDVSMHDLREDSYAAGTNIHLGAFALGTAMPVTRSWDAAHNGLMFLHYSAHGDASARVSVRAAGSEVLHNARIPEHGGGVIAMGPGSFEVGVRDLREGAGLSPGRVSVTALFADLDVPGAGLRVWPHEA